MPAHVVIAKSLQEVKRRIINDVEITNHIILWVMAIPTIWSQAANQVLKEAVTEVCKLQSHNLRKAYDL